MDTRIQRIKSIADVKDIEKIPLSQRNLAKNTYEVFKCSAEQHGNKIALSFLLEGTVDEAAFNYSYTDLYQRITQTANAFQHLNRGNKDVVSILLPNIPQNHFSLWGAEAIGIANPINPMLEPSQIIGIMNAAQSKVLVTLAPFPNNNLWEKAQEIAQQVPTLETILTVNLAQFLPGGKIPSMPMPDSNGKCKIMDFDALIAQQSSDVLKQVEEKNWQVVACYFHTGGTTGTPKIAIHSHGNQVFSGWMVGRQLDWNESDVMHCGLPLFHVNAPLITGLAPFTVGGQVIMTSPHGFRSPKVLDHFWRLIEKYKISFFMAVPAVYFELNKRWKGDTDVSSLKFAACGAAPMPTALMAEFEKRTHFPILEGYGLTEGTVFSAANPPFGDRRMGSIGIRIPYQDMQAVILDEQGKYVRNCQPNETGTIAIQGPNVFQGYLRPEENKNIWIGNGWLITGDLGQQDEEGYFKLAGRSKDLIIRGGHNIDPRITEEALSKHPAIAMVAAVGKPDVRLGELPVAYVSLREGQTVTAEELQAFAKKHITEQAAAPTNVYIINKIPLTTVGKIFKPELRCDAIKRTFEETLKPLKDHGVNFTITVLGPVTIVNLANEVASEKVNEIQSLLKGFSVATEIHQNGVCLTKTVVSRASTEKPKLPFFNKEENQQKDQKQEAVLQPASNKP